MQYPRRWQDCKLFVTALKKREYISDTSTGWFLLMSDGIYLYLYELWQDGRQSALKKGAR